MRGITIHPDDSRTAYIACGLRGWGLHRTRDAGRSFQSLGFADRWVWDVAFHPKDPETIYVGTEPPMLYISQDKGYRFRALDAIDRLPSRAHWKFFHEPFYAGHIHGSAIHPEQPERLFAGVEHGALIYSYDGGRTWQESLIGYDLHRVAIDPTNPDRIFAGAGEGLFVSEDAGLTWEVLPPLQSKYIHAIAFDPQEPRRIYVYVAEEGAPLYKSEDGGRSWRQIGKGLPEARPADSLTLHPVVTETIFYAGDVEPKKSRLFVSFDTGEHWRSISEDLPKLWRLRTGTAV